MLEQLTRAIAGMRYFAMLTDARGIVVDVQGHCDRSDPRASAIGRVGIDLSEAAVGTTAIGAALEELLRRSEDLSINALLAEFYGLTPPSGDGSYWVLQKDLIVPELREEAFSSGYLDKLKVSDRWSESQPRLR